MSNSFKLTVNTVLNNCEVMRHHGDKTSLQVAIGEEENGHDGPEGSGNRS